MDPALLIGLGLLAAWYLGRGHSPVVAAQQQGSGTPAAAPAATPVPQLGGENVDTLPRPQPNVMPSFWDPIASANAFADQIWNTPVTFGDPGAGTSGRDPRYAPGVVDAGGGDPYQQIWDWLEYGNIT